VVFEYIVADIKKSGMEGWFFPDYSWNVIKTWGLVNLYGLEYYVKLDSKVKVSVEMSRGSDTLVNGSDGLPPVVGGG